MSRPPRRPTLARAVVRALAAALLAGCSDGSGDSLVSRGRQVYLGQCTQCHNVNPEIPGPVGPPVKGASRELLEAKIVRGEYPAGYTAKRPTKVMPPQPTLAADIPGLAAYLK